MIKVAIVDDHEMFRMGIKSLFDNFNQEVVKIVTIAESADEFLNYLQRDGGVGVDVALIDFQMPEMNGVELIKELALSYPSLKSVLYSTYYGLYLMESAIEAGAKGCIAKKMNFEDLLSALNEVHNKGYYLSDDMSEKAIRCLVQKKKIKPDYDFSAKITNREREIATLVSKGLSYKEIGAELEISKRTVEDYRDSFCRKTGAEKQAGITTFCIYMGWL